MTTFSWPKMVFSGTQIRFVQKMNNRRKCHLQMIACFILLFFAFFCLLKYRVNNEKSESKQNIPHSVLQTDAKLRLIALQSKGNAEFIHPKANRKHLDPDEPKEPKMNSPRQMITVTETPLLDVQHPCLGRQGANQTVIIFLFSIASDIQRRQIIRQTYGSALRRNPKTELYFVLGREKANSLVKFQELVQQESLLYNDILQGVFEDDYYNLTLKSLTMLRWASIHCPQAKYIFKLDSDCFLRVDPLLSFLEGSDGTSMFGLVREHDIVARKDGSKWDISSQYYPYPIFPRYTPGPYLIPGSKVGQLYSAIVSHPTIDTIPSLPFDDVYVTGILAEKLNISRRNWDGIWELATKEDMENVEEIKRRSVLYQLLEEEDLVRLWSIFG